MDRENIWKESVMVNTPNVLGVGHAQARKSGREMN